MNNLNNFKFFSGATAIAESNVLSNPNHGSQLVLEVSGTATSFTLSVKGKVDAENIAYTSLGIINASDYSTSSTITDNGIYIIGVDGIGGIKLNLTAVSGGNVTAFGKLGE
jgi:hypothetical protein